MRTLDRYLASEVLKASVLAVLALTALDAFFGFIGEIEDIGRHRYGLGDAFTYIGLTLPRRLVEMLPTAALIGCLLGLGGLAVRSELVVMRAAGVSVGRIAWGVAKAGLVLVFAGALLGEFVAPWTETRASDMRTTTQNDLTAGRIDRGVWVRDGNDYLRIRHIYPDGDLLDVSLYAFDDRRRLTLAAQAERAVYMDGRWRLQKVRSSAIGRAGVSAREAEELVRETLLDPALVQVVMLKPENLTTTALLGYVGYLEGLGEDPRRYRQAFWSKLMAPLQGLVMLLVALPFAFGSTRNAPLGQRLVIGIVVGLLFHLVSRLFGQAGHAFAFDPLLSATLPSLLFLGIALLALRRVR